MITTKTSLAVTTTSLVQIWCRLLLLLVCLTPVSVAAELYKYINEDGVTVLDSHVPARYVKNGYTILSLGGRVLEVVPRALSTEEIRNRDQKLAEERRIEEARRALELADANLLRLYGGPEDVIRARDTKLGSIDSFIETVTGNLQRLEEQKRNLESNAADIERSGGSIPRAQLDRIRSVENRIRQVKVEIDKKFDEKEDLRKIYDKDLKRVSELYASKTR